ncbi:MAG: MarR family transcriptional regulator [Lachnospiraceae bacterium]|nr:MarR family transcriptional regulator [Lachnospiraceae bacterium]
MIICIKSYYQNKREVSITWLRNQKSQFMGLTAAQSEAIKYILRNYEENELTAMDVMDSLQLSQSTVAGIIKRLESKGLIERRTTEKDSRKSIISPTEKGLKPETILKKKR